MGKQQEVKSPRPQKLIQYYKKQLQDVDLNEQKESVPKNSGQKKSVQKSLSNSNFIKPRDTNKSSNKSISSSAYVEEIKKLQTQFTKPFDQNKSVQSHQSQLYQTILDQDEESQKSQRSDLFEKKHQESPIDQIIQRSQQYKDQQNKSSLNQSRQTQKHPSTKSRCKSTEGRKQSKNSQIKTKSEGNKIKYQEQTSQSQLPSSSARKSLNMDQSSQQQFREPSQPARESQQFRESQQLRESMKEQPQIRDSIPKDTKRSQGSSISQQVSQRISVKSNLVNQATPQKQEIDHEKKLSFCQQDFAQEMRGTAIFNQSDTQNKFHRHKRSQSQTELEKIADDDTQMQLVRQQQQYMQQLIEQQKRQLEELRFQQQQLEEEHASKNHKPGQVSVDSLDSYPQQSESFHQDFIRSVSEVLKSELRRKQEEDSMRDYQNHSPHFEQSKITNNQQSMFFNDQQSLDNVNAIEKQRGLSQQEDANRSRADSSMIKKQPISHSELDELQNEKNQDAQSRQSRYSRAQSQTSQRNTQSVKQQHSFHQSEQIQKKLPSEESIKKQEVKVQRSESVLSQQNSKRINDQSVRNQFDQQQEQEESILKNQIVSRQSQQSIPQQNMSHHSDQGDKKSQKHTDQKSVDLSQLSKILEKQEIPNQSHSKQPSQQSLGFKLQEQQQQGQKVQQSTVKKNLNDSEQSIEQHFKSHKQSKQPSQTQLRYVPSPSQQLLPYQVFQSDKQMQIQPDQQSENIQVTISEDQLDTKQNIQDIKLQLAAQREILSQLYNSIQESRQLKVSQFESEKRGSELRTVKRCMIPSIDPCSSPIKKVIITKGAFPAFTIIKSLSPIRM